MPNSPHVVPIDCKFVSDGLAPFFKKWHYKNPVFISAQTGSGKNTFILHSLLPYAKKEGKSILMICNRIALNIQQKRLILKAQNLQEVSSDDDLEAMEKLGIVTFWNYQKVLAYIPPCDISVSTPYYFDYIIFDEAHYFISDALFNPFTGQALDRLLHAFPRSVHIFMSATPSDTLAPLFSMESYYYSLKQTNPTIPVNFYCGSDNTLQVGEVLTVYDFIRNYNGFSFTFFSEYHQIVRLIQADSSSNKWLWFVDSKKNGALLKKKLTSDIADYLDSSRKNSKNAAWAAVLDGKLQKKVLLTTSVIDNGISINDQDVTNIVVSAIDQITLMQMVGRRRISEGEQVRLFIRVPTAKDWAVYRNQTAKLVRIVESWEQAQQAQFQGRPTHFLQRNWSRLDNNARKLFYINNNDQPVLNMLAKYKLNLLQDFYRQIQDDSEKYGGSAFPRTVLKWFGRENEYDDPLWLGCENREATLQILLEFLHSHSVVASHDYISFYDDFMTYYFKITYKKIRIRKGAELATINEGLAALELSFKYKKRNDRWILFEK